MKAITRTGFMLILLILSGCASFNSSAPADNPMEGTAQQGDPSVFEHRN